MSPLVLVLLFVVSSIVGYLIISKIPSLLHTPLMSGMNALSGITILGSISVIVALRVLPAGFGVTLLYIIAYSALILATINIVGGFGVTERMLGFFNKKKGGKDE
ncbi:MULTISPECIES: NAD(P) transhydrogenase subunit alpha [Porphyromonas]|uniref:proton-translocating NAD(P)(+) transhydrogenase n=1 Tax=Porphyromonas canoris TaxID=36875 RepID=A0ABR4XMI8_9PORP|nr:MULTISPECIES: NAD(P) transhydrogenase subunit alpha [Porphyromonas]KGL51555.1 pyridine nucleotide transhydrogenase [Porphyromonas canoris]KGN67279.1 pyridine nucleotide transhydrogenase [Porphyromonas sp. COT-108 OH1349]KGN93302.1 pyridine nucleotide transhydrogenase [Porphyromonas canoris]